MNKRQRDRIIDRLLYVTGVSIVLSIILWLTLKGLLSPYAYITRRFVGVISTISILTAITLSVSILLKKNSIKKILKYIVLFIIIAVGGAAIMGGIGIVTINTIDAMRVLWTVIVAYLAVNFAYNIYKLYKLI